MSTNRYLFLLSALLLLGLAACGDDTTDPEDGETATNYQPFAEDHLASQVLRVEAYTQIDGLTAQAELANVSEIYGQIESLYQANELQVKVAGRVDDHTYGRADIGAWLDTQIVEAMELARTAEDESTLAYAGQVVEKGLLVFFYLSVFHELSERTQKNLDEAFGYFGLSFDGTEVSGLAGMVAQREGEQGVELNRPVFNAFLDAHAAMSTTAEATEVLGDSADFDAAVAAIDAAMLRAFGYGVIHEMDEILEGEGADVELVEARLFWEALEPYAMSTAPDLATTVQEGLYPDGVPDRADDAYFVSGMEAIRDGSTTVPADAVIAAVGQILATL